jgi:hypothetical protein
MSRFIFCVGLIAVGLFAEQAHAQLGRARRIANNNDNTTTRQSDRRGARSPRNAANSANAPQPNINTRNSFAAPVTTNNAASGNTSYNPANGGGFQSQGTARSGQVLSGPTITNSPSSGPQLAEPVVGRGNPVTTFGPQAQSVMKVPATASGVVGTTSGVPAVVGSPATSARGLEENVIPLPGNSVTIITNPAATRGPVKFTINGEAMTLQAGEQITLDSKPAYVIEFTRGGGQGKTRYTLAAGTSYNFKVAATGWDLGSAPTDDVAPAAPRGSAGSDTGIASHASVAASSQ